MLKRLLLAAALLALPGTALATHTPGHDFEIGASQPFAGVVCRERTQIMWLFDTWIEKNMHASQVAYRTLAAQKQCRFFPFPQHHAFFLELLINSPTRTTTGANVDLKVFAISPNAAGTEIDFLMTWISIGNDA